MRHILSADQFSTKEINEIFELADDLKKKVADPRARKELAERYPGRQMATLFYQPSTRTRVSFETAALKLGIGVVSTPDASIISSAVKGETIEDTIKVMNGYGLDIVVIRHNQTGGVAQAAAVAAAPIINAGDGRNGEHPTQSLLDAYTIKNTFGRLNNLRLVMGGDLLQSRCVRSLSFLLSKYKNNHITFVSVPGFQVGDDVKSFLRKSSTDFSQTESMREAFKDADVVYWTRLQSEYLDKSKENSLNPKSFIITKESLSWLPKQAIIMHPLPRVDEIDLAVDKDPRAKYFEQAGNGLYIRMALIDLILKSQK